MHFRILKMITTSGFLTALECTKFDLGRPRTLLGSLQRSPRPSNWFKWALLLRGGEGSKGVEEERERKGRRGEEGRKVETSPPSVTAYALNRWLLFDKILTVPLLIYGGRRSVVVVVWKWRYGPRRIRRHDDDDVLTEFKHSSLLSITNEWVF